MNRDPRGDARDDRGGARERRGYRGQTREGAANPLKNSKDEKYVFIAGWRLAREETIAGVRPVQIAFEMGLIKRLVVPRDERRSELLHIIESAPSDCVRRAERWDFDDADACDGHQHCIGEIAPLPNPSLSEVVPESDASIVILLDGITDPRNAGAIARSAAAVGARAIALPSHNSARLGPAFYKASAGMALKLPLCRGGNLSQALDELARLDFWSVAASAVYEGAADALTFEFPKRCALVLGGEGQGIREKLEKKCDYRVFIPMNEGVESLNVSVAAGILAYLWRVSAAKP